MATLRRIGQAVLPAAIGAALLVVGTEDVFAQDLQEGVQQAAGKFKALVKTGSAVAAVVIIVIGLMMTGFRFTQKDPAAIWYLAGTAVGGVMFGVAAAML